MTASADAAHGPRRRARQASRTPSDTQPEGRGQPQEAQPASAAPDSGGRSRLSRVMRTRSSGARATSTVRPPWPRTRARGGQGAGQRHRQRVPQRTPAEERGHAEAEQQVGAEEHLEERDRRGLDRGQPQPAAAAASIALEGDQRAQGQGEGGDHGVGQGQRDEQVPAQQVGPPVRLRVGREEEREIGGQGDEAGQVDGERAAARRRGSIARRTRISAIAPSVTSKRLIES